MPAWIVGIQGVREILNAAGDALTRRKMLQFGAGFTAADDGSKTVVTLGSPSSAYSEEIAPLLRGVGLTVGADGKLAPRARPRKVTWSDHFISGNTTSGSIGALGWNLLGLGTPAIARGASFALDSARKVTLSTSTAGNDRTVLALGATEAGTMTTAAETLLMQASVNFNASLATKRFFFGLAATLETEPSAATSCLGIYYDSAVSPNYQLIARIASSGSPVVTASVVPSDTDQLLSIYQSTTGTFDFYVDNDLVGSISSGAPAVALNAGFRVETLTTSAASVRVGFFGYESISLGGVADNDAFLEA